MSEVVSIQEYNNKTLGPNLSTPYHAFGFESLYTFDLFLRDEVPVGHVFGLTNTLSLLYLSEFHLFVYFRKKNYFTQNHSLFDRNKPW